MAIYGSNYAYGESPFYKDEGFDEDVSGLFYFLHNWSYNLTLTYAFKTVLSETRVNIEQRKSLIPRPLRKQSIVVTDNESYERLWNYLQSLRTSGLYLPIYSEPCKPVGYGSLQGLSDVPVESVAYHYNLRNLTAYVLMIDLRNVVSAEVHTVGAVADGQISFYDAVVGGFRYGTTILYPLVYSYLAEKERKELTDTMTVFNLEFVEYEVYT